MKLNPDDLDVMSFDIGPAEEDATTSPNDPTPATFCRICPETADYCPAP
ncbi:MAG: hypothetical protein KY467_15195 [Gemmatimonadetes bacterium]|nr:hypothetical protein [Gemmatimonadota bacterium]